ncbi:FUSC family protein [Acidihalobacter ferrooxydans]|uniref:FUSC family protein n=1 Tax=Acidihalobacter ferrooxydans TaxID=1765967 RepID=UPI00202A859A|nr:FUSC family protein [Acidihalobacter ferrooxydans]
MKQMALGALAGIVSAFFLQFLILPQMDGFTLWAASLLPFILVGFYLYTRPTLSGIGTGFMVFLSLMLMQVDAMNFSAVGYFDLALGLFFGLLGALMGFILFAGVYGSRWLQNRLRSKLRLQVVRTCHESLDGLLGRFESASRDVLFQIAGLTPPGSSASRHLLASALSMQEIGRAVIELRQHLAHVSDAPLSARVLDDVAAVYATPSTQHYRQALNSINAALDSTAHDAPETAHLHLIRLALLDARAVLSADPTHGKSQPRSMTYAA